MRTADLAFILPAVALVVLTVGAYLRARGNRVTQAEAVLESPRWSVVVTSVGALAMLVLVAVALSLHPPASVLDHMSYIGILLATAIGVSAVSSKRLVLAGDRVIDVSLTGRRRDLVLSDPVRFETVPLGWRLRTSQQSVFVPGYWLMGDTETSVRQIESFKELVFTRAERSAPPAVTEIDT